MHIFAVSVGLTRRAEYKLKLPADKQWKPTLFKIEAVEIYKEMNRLFAEKNIKELKRFCHESMFQVRWGHDRERGGANVREYERKSERLTGCEWIILVCEFNPETWDAILVLN